MIDSLRWPDDIGSDANRGAHGITAGDGSCHAIEHRPSFLGRGHFRCRLG